MFTDENTIFFTIDTELTPDTFRDLIIFIHRHYLMPHLNRFINIQSVSTDNLHLISFVLPDPAGMWWARVEVKAGKPIEVKIVKEGPVPEEVISKLKEDLFIAVQLFEEQVRLTSFYFAWVEGEPVVLERKPRKEGNIIYRMFTESMLLFFVIFIAVSIFLFMIFGPYTPIMLVVLQFVIFLFSDKIVMRMGSWNITREKPSVHIFHYHLPVEEYRDFIQRFSRDVLMKIKAEIYERTLAIGKAVDCETVNEVFSRYGFTCRYENMSTKSVNVYEIVKKAAESYSSQAAYLYS